jgi:hypothetical protein
MCVTCALPCVPHSCVSGKRFGLTASRNLAVGDLLLVTPPVAVAFGAAGMTHALPKLQNSTHHFLNGL